MWGIETLIDLKGCDPEIIRSPELIKSYVDQLVELIDMKAYGDIVIEDFGSCVAVAGITMVQMIETSLISAHFVNVTNDAYINIFSCKFYDSDMASKFTANYFRADKMIYHRMTRGY